MADHASGPSADTLRVGTVEAAGAGRGHRAVTRRKALPRDLLMGDPGRAYDKIVTGQPGDPVPVTAKLSREFYDKFGDKIANELVNWFNQVDASYRSEFKDLFEVHFSRFDAKLEQRWAQLDAKLEQRLAEVRAELDAKIDWLAAELRVTLERRLGEQTRWLFGAWAIVLASVIGLWFRQ